MFIYWFFQIWRTARTYQESWEQTKLFESVLRPKPGLSLLYYSCIEILFFWLNQVHQNWHSLMLHDKLCSGEFFLPNDSKFCRIRTREKGSHIVAFKNPFHCVPREFIALNNPLTRHVKETTTTTHSLRRKNIAELNHVYSLILGSPLAK